VDIEIRARTGRTVEICPSGELDLATAPELHRVLEALAGNGIDVVIVDLSSVTFMDAAGLTPFLELAAQLELVVLRPSRPVRRLLEVCDLDGWLDDTRGTPAPSPS
jgi:anti-sigma B factor antagonist